MTKDERIFQTIVTFAKRENELLAEHFHKGIFDMPELAFAYEIGKRVALELEKHLGSISYDWVRECDFGNGGPTDLAFISNDMQLPNYAIEFKMDDTVQKYAADIRKLAVLNGGLNEPARWEKYFCALKWVLHKDQGDGFLNSMESAFGESAKLVNSDGFACIVGNSAKKQYCLLTLWRCK